MCGIVGYTGRQPAVPVILEGLRRLEYRGYDSAGICTMNGHGAEMLRCEGKLANLERLLTETPLGGTIGIGHTRWATHGRPSEKNAHPHRAGEVFVVHNGIIENHRELKEKLERLGHSFRSDTDTEVISHLIEHNMKLGSDFETAVRESLRELRGAYALCILCEGMPGTLIAARNGSPLVVGLGEREFLVASDIPALLSHTRRVVFLDDGEVALFCDGEASLTRIDGRPVAKEPTTIDWTPVMAEKGGFRHFMLKEIFEQPRAIADTIAGQVFEEEGAVFLDELKMTDDELAQVSRVVIVACGTSWHAGLVGKFLLEDLCRLPVEVEIASEYRYRNPVVGEESLVLAISQSGETADTLAALREAKLRGARTATICNVVGSSIAREAHGVIYTHAGPEIGVASTKAFVTQLAALHLLAIRLGRTVGTISREKGRELIGSLVKLPGLVEETLRIAPVVEAVARGCHHARDFLYLGRGSCYPVALEGALKLKEISYIHAEGYPAGEMKHGPIALIDEQMPVVVLAPRNAHYEKTISNMEEVIARGGRVIAVATEGDDTLVAKAEIMLEIPEAPPELLPILATVPLQLLAYHVAVLRGNDVDQPRNLAKSVTVE
ncbi:glucosamine/fructose-6-phosphate aminotransferase, isomerizing [Geobacter metallireducens RCH3]|uniref:Glutamine--fructose-6-phosphate aminotransferase [isomerizing] n=1 Tax=Geobacter metallireducens (strain ATCC 53774 / DSM 7210 / GS-15) TaxID=269799 RepID=Q39VK3_GEOMG|nr:glutamine--fructose-6-phosphate transaminase (isomerizing) [Geobacter metallireducens]ABB31721.1 glutamine--fructose-6-phosphate aminotransferase [Geobacter metallireducens GS-15]EHP89401.1 glucosamine/fructose-6-phosphate aminotransferase, isomerizing [Geobacter metallireducens RCH3]